MSAGVYRCDVCGKGYTQANYTVQEEPTLFHPEGVRRCWYQPLCEFTQAKRRGSIPQDTRWCDWRRGCAPQTTGGEDGN